MARVTHGRTPDEGMALASVAIDRGERQDVTKTEPDKLQTTSAARPLRAVSEARWSGGCCRASGLVKLIRERLHRRRPSCGNASNPFCLAGPSSPGVRTVYVGECSTPKPEKYGHKGRRWHEAIVLLVIIITIVGGDGSSSLAARCLLALLLAGRRPIYLLQLTYPARRTWPYCCMFSRPSGKGVPFPRVMTGPQRLIGTMVAAWVDALCTIAVREVWAAPEIAYLNTINIVQGAISASG